jgi:AhpD family alkylhydroperoxidase
MKKEKSIFEFWEEREKLNEIVLKNANLNIKRFLNLDNDAYKKGALDEKTKELLGFVASLVLRCDDCIFYHLYQLKEKGIKKEELIEAINIGLVVGGSITIPHIRRVLKAWEELNNK